MAVTGYSETNSLLGDAEVAAIYRTEDARVEAARERAEWALRNRRTDLDTAQAWVAEVAQRAAAARDLALAALRAGRMAVQPPARRLVLVPALPVGLGELPLCTEGSCLDARPGSACHCRSCHGRDHGARSTLAAAACQGTRVLADRDPRGGYRYSSCPGCPGCRVVAVVSTVRTEDAFARLARAGGMAAPDFDW